MNPFKAGDRVVRKDGNNFGHAKKCMEVTVSRIEKSMVWFLETGTWLNYTALRFARASGGMKLSDLKDGMIVTYRNGDKRIVEDGKLLEKGSVTSSLTSFGANLLHTNYKSMDIVRVEVPSYTWEREIESYKQKEIEDIRVQMEKLAARLKQVEKKELL